MAVAVEKDASSEKPSVKEMLEKATPQTRAAYKRLLELRRGNEGLVDTAAVIREVRGG